MVQQPRRVVYRGFGRAVESAPDAPAEELLEWAKNWDSGKVLRSEPMRDGVPLVFSGLPFDPEKTSENHSAEPLWSKGHSFIPTFSVYRRAIEGTTFGRIAVLLEPNWSETELESAVAEAVQLDQRPQITEWPVFEETNETPASWVSRVERAKADIQSGRVSKVVLARSKTVYPTEGKQFSVLETLPESPGQSSEMYGIRV